MSQREIEKEATAFVRHVRDMKIEKPVVPALPYHVPTKFELLHRDAIEAELELLTTMFFQPHLIHKIIERVPSDFWPTSFVGLAMDRIKRDGGFEKTYKSGFAGMLVERSVALLILLPEEASASVASAVKEFCSTDEILEFGRNCRIDKRVTQIFEYQMFANGKDGFKAYFQTVVLSKIMSPNDAEILREFLRQRTEKIVFSQEANP